LCVLCVFCPVLRYVTHTRHTNCLPQTTGGCLAITILVSYRGSLVQINNRFAKHLAPFHFSPLLVRAGVALTSRREFPHRYGGPLDVIVHVVPPRADSEMTPTLERHRNAPRGPHHPPRRIRELEEGPLARIWDRLRSALFEVGRIAPQQFRLPPIESRPSPGYFGKRPGPVPMTGCRQMRREETHFVIILSALTRP